MSRLLSFGLAAVIATTAALPMASFAQEDSEATANFKNVGRVLRNARTMDAAALATNLTEIRQYLVANSSITPGRPAGATDEQVAEFHREMHYALGMFDAAIAMANAGNADAAKALLAEVNSFREKMHKKYEI